MTAGERMVNEQGVEICLFPLEYMNISQGEGGSYSHAGTLSIDFLGWDAFGRVTECPYYAPCSCKVVQHASYYNIWQSIDQVITPTGKRYISFVVMHDANPPALGTIAAQGDMIGHTGTNTRPGGTPVTGDHVHINGAGTTFQGWVQNGKQLKNYTHLYNLFYINDTIIVNDYNYPWRIYQGGITPYPATKYHFKWVLYANKLRNKMSS